MEVNRLVESVLERPIVYRAWQSWHARQKFAPILGHNDLSRVRRVLDVGCGPGTSVPFFDKSDYLGIDVNQDYIESARRRFNRKFVAADATTYAIPPSERFDFILINSFLHHIDDVGVRKIISHLPSLLTDAGCIHILELALPPDKGLPRAFARLDRGKFPRPIEVWVEVFSEFFEPRVVEPYSLTALGIPWLDMVYFKGRAKL